MAKKKEIQFTTEEMVDKLVDMRVKEAASQYTLMDFLKQEGYSTTHTYELLGHMRKRIQEMYKDTLKDALENSLSNMEQLYQEAFKSKNYKVAASVRNEINKVLGLNNKEKVEVSGELVFKAKFSDKPYENNSDEEI